MSSQARLGQRIGEGRYHILRILGEGGMGAVFGAHDERDDVEVALKLLHPRLGAEARYLARFQREAEVTSSLNHPHVVKALDTGVEPDGTAWLVMELVEGVSLSAYLRARGAPLGVSASVGIARQIVSALSAASEIGVIHRDLKPGNIMVVEDGQRLRAKVVDFGIARFMSSPTYETLTLTGQVLGTPAYMAPEQAFGDRVDAAADIYSVGAILHALLVGSPPFGRGPEVLVRLMRGERERLTETHPELGPITEVVERCLSAEPEHRFRDADELDRALAPLDTSNTVLDWIRPTRISTMVLEPDPVLDAPRERRALAAAAPPTPSSTVGKGVARQEPGSRKWWLLAAGLAALLGGALCVVMLRTHRTPSPPSTPSSLGEPVSPVVVGPTTADTGGAPRVDEEDVGADLAAEDDGASGPGRARSRGARCAGHTDVWVRRGSDAPLIRQQLLPTVGRAISAQCFTTLTKQTESDIEIDIGDDGRARQVRVLDSGELSRGETACVVGAIRRHTRLHDQDGVQIYVEVRAGWRPMTFHFSPNCD